MSCNQQKKEDGSKIKRAQGVDSLTAFAEQQKKNPDADQRLVFWRKVLKTTTYGRDSILKSVINYRIAGIFYEKNKLDSVKHYMQISWGLMENHEGFDDQKVLLYSGLGNIANLEQRVHQENYYYMRAGQMLMADSSIKLTPKQKATVYLAGAQTSAKLRQFSNAFKLNRKALAVLDTVADQVDLKFRACSQLALCFFNTNGNPDSLQHYIKRMQSLYNEKPDFQKARFIADRKGVYFERKGLSDSMYYYHRKKMNMDLEDAKANGNDAKSIRSGNLLLSYFDMCAYFVNDKQLDSSLVYLNKCEQFAKVHPLQLDDESTMLYRQNLVNYLFASKQYLKAEKQQELLMADFRRFYEAENARAIAEMSAIVEIKTKNKSISNLNTTVALAEQRFQTNRLWLAVSALTALLAVAVATLLFYIQRQRKLRDEHEKAHLEQRLLRTQMEPHFIFNTLSALQSFVRFDEKDKALKYLSKFGHLLRSSLELSRESLVPLSDEIETLENYLSLQQMRYEHAFDYQIILPEEQDLESVYIPPMLMQPFVENALLHGIDPNARAGKITIEFSFSQDVLVVTIADNGKGIEHTVNADALKHKSLSTTISKERLAIIARETGKPAGITIKSESGRGTTVTITVPSKLVSELS